MSNTLKNSSWDEGNSILNMITDTQVSAKHSTFYVDQSINKNCFNTSDSIAKIAKITECELMPSFFLIGAPTNILSMIVFYRQGLRDRMNLCLFCLAFTDLMYVTALFIGVFYCFIGLFLPTQELFWRYSLLTHSFNFIYGFAYLSGCLTMIIAVERCVCVLFPMKAVTLVSTKTMATALVVTFLLIHGLCSVYAFKEQALFVRNPASGESISVMTTSELFLSNSIFKIIENIVLSFVSFFSFIVVLTATFVTVIRLSQFMSWRRKSANGGSSYLKSQAVLIKMLVAVSCVYILCAAPNVALALARFTVPEFRGDGAQCNLFVATHSMGCAVLMFNSSINFFVYSTMSVRFRKELKTIFHCFFMPRT